MRGMVGIKYKCALAPQSQSEIATNKGISPRGGGALGIVFN